jgi:hypothetical protein
VTRIYRTTTEVTHSNSHLVKVYLKMSEFVVVKKLVVVEKSVSRVENDVHSARAGDNYVRLTSEPGGLKKFGLRISNKQHFII